MIPMAIRSKELVQLHWPSGRQKKQCGADGGGGRRKRWWLQRAVLYIHLDSCWAVRIKA